MKIIKKTVSFFLPYYSSYKKFNKARLSSNYFDFLKFKFGFQKRYWPAHVNCTIANYKNIYVGINALIGRPGNYIQGAGNVFIGNYVQFGPNVGILSSNHDLYDQRISNNERVIIGNYSWVGMNSVVLPGVKLGTRTIVAAGSVVTKSFPEGFCVIAGAPAKMIKELNRSNFKPWKDEEEFYGFVPKSEFENSINYIEYLEKINENLNC
jgi:acetyltransferase-like isoleucine patch superfamily enzyme